jgi:SAM-dependent methyltransferase
MLERKSFQGVLNILDFNRHYYYFGLTILLILILIKFIFAWSGITFWIVIVSFVYGLLMPLIVSAYVYDFSGYYNFNWLNPLIDNPDNKSKLVNINAGFDETSYILESKFPNAKIDVFDFYNDEHHTEAAIKRARKVSLVYPDTSSIETDKIPLENASVDAIFLLSSAHEIRDDNEKVKLFKECKRILIPNGQIIVVEHLRDFPNFLAFTIGFTHFFSSNTWKKSFKLAGFESVTETKFTPFMSVYNVK